MSLEVFQKLEEKIQQAIDTIALLQMEIEDLKEQKSRLKAEVEQVSSNSVELVNENEKLKEEQSLWEERLQSLIGKIEASSYN